MSITLIAVTLTLKTFHHIKGVREGTVIAALTVGMFARIFGRKLIYFTKWVFPDTTSSKIRELDSGEI